MEKIKSISIVHRYLFECLLIVNLGQIRHLIALLACAFTFERYHVRFELENTLVIIVFTNDAIVVWHKY